MVLCPECESDLDIEEDEIDEGEVVSCAECGTDFEVITVWRYCAIFESAGEIWVGGLRSTGLRSGEDAWSSRARSDGSDT